MLNTLLGTKLKMLQVYDVDGKRWVGTWIKVGPCAVIQVKNNEKDGYTAVQIRFGKTKIEVQGVEQEIGDLKKGVKIIAKDVFEVGDIVRITGVSKGKGFAGVVKRWGFSGGPKTHGQSDRHRSPGSIGAGTTPGRVLKGKKMPGRMGGDRISIDGLVVLDVDKKNGRLLVSGPVPGARMGLLEIIKLGKKKNFVGLFKQGSEDSTKVEKTEKMEEKESGVVQDKTDGKEKEKLTQQSESKELDNHKNKKINETENVNKVTEINQKDEEGESN